MARPLHATVASDAHNDLARGRIKLLRLFHLFIVGSVCVGVVILSSALNLASVNNGVEGHAENANNATVSSTGGSATVVREHSLALNRSGEGAKNANVTSFAIGNATVAKEHASSLSGTEEDAKKANATSTAGVGGNTSLPPKLHIVTAANKMVEAVQLLNQSSFIYGGVPLKVIISRGAHKYFVKVDAMRNIDTVVHSPDDLVLFADAFDTLVTIPAGDIVRRFAALEEKLGLNNSVVFNGASAKCFPFESWNWKTDDVFTLSNGVNVTGREVCEGFRRRFGGANPCLNSGLYIGRARDIAEVNQFVWDNRNVVKYMTDQTLYMQAAKVFTNMVVDSNSTLFRVTHEMDASKSDLCQSKSDAGVLHFTGKGKGEWIAKCSQFYLGNRSDDTTNS